MSNHRFTLGLVAAGLTLPIVAAGCSSDGSDGAPKGEPSTTILDVSDDQALAVATTYADVVSSSYDELVASTEELRTSIADFLAE